MAVCRERVLEREWECARESTNTHTHTHTHSHFTCSHVGKRELWILGKYERESRSAREGVGVRERGSRSARERVGVRERENLPPCWGPSYEKRDWTKRKI